ncbi:hypothetical protein [Providencia rettgeri]|uniref:hypothetical protein n=1 Tax=Providencia rettgeri TaxID=587 RepID=UPI003016CD02
MRFTVLLLLCFSVHSHAVIKTYNVTLSDTNYKASAYDPNTGFWSAPFTIEYPLKPYEAIDCFRERSFSIAPRTIAEKFIQLPNRNPSASPPSLSAKFNQKVKCTVDWVEDKPQYTLTDKANSVILTMTYRAFYCPNESAYSYNDLSKKEGCPTIEHGNMEKYCLEQPTLRNTTVKNPSHDGKDYIFNNPENGCKYYPVGDLLLIQDNPLRVTADWATIGIADLDSGESEIIENEAGNGNEGGNSGENGNGNENGNGTGSENGGEGGNTGENGGENGNGSESGNNGGGNENGNGEGGNNGGGSSSGEYAGVLNTIRTDTQTISKSTTSIDKNVSSLNDKAASMDDRLANIDGNVAKIERYLRPEEHTFTEWLTSFDTLYRPYFSTASNEPNSIFNTEFGYRNQHEFSLYGDIASNMQGDGFARSFSSVYREQLSGLTSHLPSHLQLSSIANQLDGAIRSDNINFGTDFQSYGTFTSIFGIGELVKSLYQVLPKYKECTPISLFAGYPYELTISCEHINKIKDFLYYVFFFFTLWFTFTKLMQAISATPAKDS